VGFSSISDKKRRLSLARAEDELEIRKAAWRYPTTGSRYGNIIISDDKGLAGAVVTGAYSEEKVLIRDIFSKGISGAPAESGLIVEGIDLGYPYLNKPRFDQHGEGRFMSGDGYPLPIFESILANGGASQTHRSVIFACDEVMYLATKVSNCNRLAINGWVHGMDGSHISDGTVETVGGHRLITVFESKSQQWFVLGMTPENQIAINTSNIGEESGFADNLNPISGDHVYFAVGQEPLAADSNTETLICWSIGLTKAETQARVAAALTAGHADALASAKAYWTSFFEGVREKWLYVPARLRYMGYVALQQIAVACCNIDAKGLWMSAGPGRWYANFIRDTAWCIRAVSQATPTLAAGMLDWLVNGPAVDEPIDGTNAYRLDGTEPGDYFNTDNAATFLLATAEYYRVTGDTVRMTALKPQLLSALIYAETYFDETDGHMEAKHPHDFGDDGNTVFPFADIQYESYIDALWIVALEAIAPVFTLLTEPAKAAFCTATATAMRANFEDFRQADGTLAHSLKPDGTLQTSSLFGASMILDAWLLGGDTSFEAMATASQTLGLRQASLQYPLVNINPTANKLADEAWVPFLPIVALVAARNGDMEPLAFVMEAFPSAVWPETMSMVRRFDTRHTIAEITDVVDGLKLLGLSNARGDVLQVLLQEMNIRRGDERGKAPFVAEVASQAPSFPWSHSAIVELVNGIAALR
jgi:hypothetical protein